jgi:hypothetical protein
MVVTQNGHPIAILCAVTEDQIDESLAAIRRAKATIAVAQLQSRAAEHSLSQLAAEQIDLEIRQSRSQRRLTPGS